MPSAEEKSGGGYRRRVGVWAPGAGNGICWRFIFFLALGFLSMSLTVFPSFKIRIQLSWVLFNDVFLR